MSTEDDLAFVAWASRRHRWLWSLGFGRKRIKSAVLRSVAIRAAVASLRLDRLAWRLRLVRQ
jgi:hypothetical protein